MIAWREKWRAFAIHFALTLALALCAAAVIFIVWYPDPFDDIVGGAELFTLVVGCDLALGPLLSLVVYNRRKSRGKLVFDYCVIGLVQLAAVGYGMWIVAGARPAYIAFVGDRLDIVAAADIRPAELAAAREPKYGTVPMAGPRLVAVVVPPADHDDALFQALAGNEEPTRPKFYVPYESQLAAIRTHALPLAELEKRHPEAKMKLAAARAATGLPETRLRWLPLRFHEIFWTVLVDADSGKPLAYFDVDPY
jgi:hypothetical protein